MHHQAYTGGTGAPNPVPSYAPKIWRGYDVGINWRDIETSDNVFTWTTIKERIAYAVAQGKDVFYQIFGAPTFHLVSGQPWAVVKDQTGAVGACCIPKLDRLSRFVTNLLTECPDIKYLSTWNEPKWDGPVLKFQGTQTGTITAGQTVTGNVTGVTATVLSAANGWLMVRLPVGAALLTPFNDSEVISVDGSNYFSQISGKRFSVSYWLGTKQQLVDLQQTVYAAAHAAKSDIIVTTPDFTEGANVTNEEEWLETWLDAGGKGYFDALAYHFYNYEVRPDKLAGRAYSIIQRCDDIDRILASRGIQVPKIASECGFLPGSDFWVATAYRAGQGHTLKRITAYLAARGWQGVIWFNDSDAYCGDPAAYSDIAEYFRQIGVELSGKTISGAYVAQDNTLRMLVDGSPVIL